MNRKRLLKEWSQTAEEVDRMFANLLNCSVLPKHEQRVKHNLKTDQDDEFN